jgi:hypothetical protein
MSFVLAAVRGLHGTTAAFANYGTMMPTKVSITAMTVVFVGRAVAWGRISSIAKYVLLTGSLVLMC